MRTLANVLRDPEIREKYSIIISDIVLVFSRTDEVVRALFCQSQVLEGCFSLNIKKLSSI